MGKSQRIYGYRDDGTPMTTQPEVIREYMRQGHSLTQAQAWEFWGFSRLSALIYEVKRYLNDNDLPYRVETTYRMGVSRFGIPVHWHEYRMVRI